MLVLWRWLFHLTQSSLFVAATAATAAAAAAAAAPLAPPAPALAAAAVVVAGGRTVARARGFGG
jgi:hypothetical protein